MPFFSGTADVGEDPTMVCAVPEGGVMVKNLGGGRVYFGAADVGNDGDAAGFPLDAGETAHMPGAAAKETPVVPAPEGDMDPPQLFARTAAGGGVSKVSWISVAMT